MVSTRGGQLMIRTRSVALLGLLSCALMFGAMTASAGFNAASGSATAASTVIPKPRVRMHTNRGDIVIELWPDKSPKTVENFLRYVDEGFYTGTIFHRVINGTLIQGGGYTKYMQLKPTHDPIKNESKNRIPHQRGTIAMARLPKPDSATAQFFINTRRNSQLDYRSEKSGYAIFGMVVEGMDIVDAIAAQKTGEFGAFSDVPLNLILIEMVTRVPQAAN